MLAYWSKTVEILIASVIGGGQILHLWRLLSFVPDMDTFQKSVSFYFSYGSACDIYEYPEGIRQTDSKILEMAKYFR